jgi:thymidylate kinase
MFESQTLSGERFEGKSTMAGKLIVFEGVDGIGKSALSKEVTRRLVNTDVAIASLAFPGNDPGTLGSLIYQIHHDPESFRVSAISALALQTLHVAAHLDAIETKIIPLIDAGTWIILDRYWWSTWVYGIERRIDPVYLQPVIEAELARWGPLKPDLIFMVDRSEAVRAEHDAETFLRLRMAYKELAERERECYRVVSINNENFEQSTEVIWMHLSSLLFN